jgi:hypothetical protein
MLKRITLAVVLSFAGVGLACDLEKRIDCNDICDHLQDCLAAPTRVSAWTTASPSRSTRSTSATAASTTATMVA